MGPALRLSARCAARAVLAATWVSGWLASGCTLLEPYPTPAPREVCGTPGDEDLDGLLDCADRSDCAREPSCLEAMHCDDHEDQDLDALVDCADPDCDGQCTEEDRAACANGRDDDGDGRTDLADPRCWPFGAVRLDRCPSVVGTDRTLATASDFDAFTGVVEAADPDDATRTVFGTSTLDASLVARDLDGTWIGSAIDARVRVAGSAIATLALGPVSLAVRPAGATLGVEELESGGALAASGVDGWWDLHVEIGGDRGHVTVTAHVTPPSGGGRDATIEPVHEWPATGRVDARWALSPGTSGSVWLDTLHVVRPAGVSCLATFDTLRGVPTSTAPAPVQHGACIAGYDSAGAPMAWTLVETVVVGWSSLALGSDLPLAPAIASRGNVDGTLVGVSQRADGTLVLLAGADCSSWMPEGDAFSVTPSEVPMPVAGAGPLPSIPAYGLWYVLRQPDPRGAPEHEIAVATTVGGARGVLFGRSLTGAPGSFEVSSFRSLEAVLDDRPGEGWRSRIDVVALGADHVYLVGRHEWLEPGYEADVVRLWIDESDVAGAGSDGLVEIPLARIAPSGVDGALDRAGGIGGALLIETEAPPAGFQAYLVHRNTIPGDVADVATLTIVPPATCANPTPETCNGIDDDCNGLIDDLGPELCDGVDEDCDGIDDAHDPDATSACHPTTPPYTSAACGVLSAGPGGSTRHVVEPSVFGCVESYEGNLRDGTLTGCDPGYEQCSEPARGCTTLASDCWWVVCAERGCL